MQNDEVAPTFISRKLCAFHKNTHEKKVLLLLYKQAEMYGEAGTPFAFKLVAVAITAHASVKDHYAKSLVR